MAKRSASRWMNMRSALFAAVALAVLLGIALVSSPPSEGSNSTLTNIQDVEANELERVDVVRIVDGDTIVVAFPDGSEDKVRLVGIDAPESVAADESRNTEEGRIASDYLKGLLSVGAPVWLERDVSDRDQYGRLLRYVWLEKPVDPTDEQEIAAYMLNAVLVDQGYARAKRYAPDTAYNEVLQKLGKEAARENRGVSYAWA